MLLRPVILIILSAIVAGWVGTLAAATVGSTSEQMRNATTEPASPPRRDDYFISVDTVIIGCTAGAAAGALASVPSLVGVARTGAGLVASLSRLNYLTWMGCSVGAASGIVAVITAMLLPSHD